MALRQAILILYQEFPFALDAKSKELHYNNSTRALIRLLYARPDYHFALYISHQEAMWLKEMHPESIAVLQEMSLRKQLEILGGPFDEPFLALLPVTDRTGQIESAVLWARENFKKKPRGVFLPGGIWEPQVAGWLKSNDFDYSFVPLDLFDGKEGHQTILPYTVEDMGKNILLFPYYPLSVEENSDGSAEKIASMPAHDDHIITLLFEGGYVQWLENFLNSLTQKGLTLIQPSSYVRKYAGRSFPTAYLPPSNAKKIGGSLEFYRHFLLKKESARLLYARSLYTSLIVRQIKKEKNIKKVALETVWQSQNHALYWHSRYGGLSHPLYRQWAYRKLLQADNIVRSTGEINYGLLRNDFDMDGCVEVLYQGAIYNAFCRHRGALIFELDYLQSEKSYLNIYDTENSLKSNKAFHDYFLDQSLSYEQWECGSDEKGAFYDDFYELTSFDSDNNKIIYHLEKPFEGTLLSIKKSYRFMQQSFELEYELANKALVDLNKKIAFELYLSLDHDHYIMINGIRSNDLMIENIRCIQIIDNQETIISITFDHPTNLWRKSLYNQVMINGHLKKIYQGEQLLFHYNSHLKSGCQLNQLISFRISSHDELNP